MRASVRALGIPLSIFMCFPDCTAVAQTCDAAFQINLPAGSLADALDKLGDQSGVQIMYEPALTAGIKVAAVGGTLTAHDALTQLLAPTGLKVDRVNDKTVVLRRAEVKKEPVKQEPVENEPADSPTGDRAWREPLDEIVVTARLREEPLQDVPASIAAASGKTIEALNIVEITELDSIAPGLTFVTKPGRFGSGPAVALRGISTFTQSPAIQDSVSTVIDGIPISRAKAGAFPDLDDVERVEVLRGPQGTLFGKNASAGVISIATREPTADFQSQMRFGYTTYNDRTIHASVSGPIKDEILLGRIALYGKARDGFIKNTFSDTQWDDDNQAGIRGKLAYMPSENDEVKLSVDFLQQENDAGTQTVRAFQPATPQYIRDILAPIVGIENDKINVRSVGDNGQDASSNTQRTWGVALQWDHSFAHHTLTAITGYRGWTQDAASGVYAWFTPLNDGNTLFYYDTKQYSGELRIASRSGQFLDYVAGLFVFADEIGTGLRDPDPGLAVLSAAGVRTGRQQRNWANLTETVDYAAFGEADAHLTDQITLTAGLRWTQEKVDATITGLPTTPGVTRIVVPLGITQDSQTADNLSWRLGGRWKIDEDRMLYVSASTGFKGPGFNVVSAIAGNAQPVRPETATSFEAGLKSQFLDTRLTFNVSAFHAIYKDFQTQGFVFVGGSTVGQIQLANAGKLRTQGFETELVAHVSESTDISLNATHIDGIFREFENAQCYTAQPVGPGECSVAGATGRQDLSGKGLANTPKWAFNTMVSQGFALPGTTWKGLVTLDYSWRSSVRWDVLGSPLAIEDSYGLLGASLGIQSENERIAVKVYGKNLTDEFHTAGIIVGQAVTQFLPTDYSRILGVSVAFRF